MEVAQDTDAVRALGAAIREARIAAGLTQKELAEKVGVGREAVAFWECGRNEPKGLVFVRIAAALGVTAETLAANSNAAA